MGYFGLISDIASSLFCSSLPQKPPLGCRRSDAGGKRAKCRASISPVREGKEREALRGKREMPRLKNPRSRDAALVARKSAAFGQIAKIEKSRPGETQRKIVRKMPRLFTPNWTSAAFRHRLSSTSLKGWAVYALSESP